jgi:hypothetical protein
MSANDTCKLLALPAELRLKVYGRVLTALLGGEGTIHIQHDTVLVFLSTCRQVRAEGTPEFIRVLHLHIISLQERIDAIHSAPAPPPSEALWTNVRLGEELVGLSYKKIDARRLLNALTSSRV